MKLLFCVVFSVAVLQVTAVDTQDEKNAFPDYWQDDDYDNYFDVLKDDSKESIEEKEDVDKKGEAEIQDFIGNNEEENKPFSSEEFDALGDYQIEDNRSNADNKENDDGDVPVEKQPYDASKLNPVNAPVGPLQPIEDVKENDEAKDMYDEWSNELSKNKDDPFSDLKENVASSEVQEAVNEENSDNKEDSYIKSVNEGNVDPLLDQIIEDTKKNLEGNNEFDSNVDDNKNNIEEEPKINYDDDTPEKVLEDLSDDLDKLFQTLDKLSDNDSDLGENEDLGDESEEIDDIQDYEEKFKRPYGEGYIMSLRDDYDYFLNSNLTNNENADKSNETELDEDVAKDKTAEVEKAEVLSLLIDNEKSNADNNEFSDEIAKLSLDDSGDKEFEDDIKKHYYGNDGLVDENLPKNDDAEVFLTASSTVNSKDTVTSSTPIENKSSDAYNKTTTEADKEVADTAAEASSPNRAVTEESVTTEEVENKNTMKVDELNSSEYNELMSKFAVALENSQDSDNQVRNIAPIHVTLSLDEPTVITSPNYPNFYPMGITMDWVIDGPGVGIEFNITSCDINGFINDYLLVKPGRIDAEGSDGLIFSFQLTSERRYRFMNVNRMFVRFQTHTSNFFNFNGFSFSAKMIFPPPPLGEDEELPEPEQVVTQAVETTEINLAGLPILQFLEVRSQFKQLIEAMAQAYIEDNYIDLGYNTTLEANITRTALCNIRWPNHETCVRVRFAVPLPHTTEDTGPRLNATELDTMWRTYSVQEPFATTLSDLRITEYVVPDDSSILTVWLVIAFGVVIAMCLLAVALWRFSCFVDYTRMKSFSDSDSIQNEKRNLDLFPTPHQTLPPLYTESDYKWADEKYEDSTRVDLGGYANKSYIRDDLFDLDSDEDVIVPHDRKTVISPRDVYDV
ncbi:unnamed protein product [Arctia plantaginis]|uniref:CUB domain-containing protein n=1 Tax=Arctia plantaginis TaxID=874455 RepID=A0A8S0Z106_ARCPL|nr:unnamed protein product [Arctia plantaginis]CAB3240405.1 unnamed protein product [Arctia plantaginis]